MSRTPSERSVRRDRIGGYPFDSSFVFSLSSQQVGKDPVSQTPARKYIPFAERALLRVRQRLLVHPGLSSSTGYSQKENVGAEAARSNREEGGCSEQERVGEYARLKINLDASRSAPPPDASTRDLIAHHHVHPIRPYIPRDKHRAGSYVLTLLHPRICITL